MSELYDCIIVGGGVAGLSASIYLARAKCSTLLIEKESFGGQINITDNVVNYPGIEKTSGKELSTIMKKQAIQFGAECINDEVVQCHLSPLIKEVETKNKKFKALSVIIATGAHPRKLNFPGEKEFQGRGIAYCATCDGEFFQDQDVFVVGGGYAACQEAHYLTRYAKHITMVVREEDFTCAKQVSDMVRHHDKITILFEHTIEKVEGIECVERVYIRNNRDNQLISFEGKRLGVFIFVGYEPETQYLKNSVELDEQGYLLVDKNQQTNVAGVFGAGDVCQKELRQVVTATSDGAIAATNIEKYISKLKNDKNIKTKSIVVKEDDYQDQLQMIASKLKRKVHYTVLDNGTEQSQKMKEFLEEFCKISDLLTYDIKHDDEAVILLFDENSQTRFAFYMVPGGHEINSFVYATYALSTMEQLLDYQPKETVKIFVSLTCTQCPELVMNMIRICQRFKNIQLKIYDLKYYPQYQNQYNIMSVPCMLIGEDVYFGKKSEEELELVLKKKI